MIKRLLQDLLSFVKKPTDERLKLNLKERLLALLVLFSIDTLIAYAFLPISDFAEAATQAVDTMDNTLEGAFGMILGIMLVPFIEEVIFRYFLRYERINPWLINRKKWDAIFPVLVYSSSIAFGMSHISNFSFSFNQNLWFIYPLLVLPQLFGGLILAYIRVRLNFRYGVVYHMLWNLIWW